MQPLKAPEYVRSETFPVLLFLLNPVASLPSKAKNQINNPALNNRRILIAGVFHYVAAVKEHK